MIENRHAFCAAREQKDLIRLLLGALFILLPGVAPIQARPPASEGGRALPPAFTVERIGNGPSMLLLPGLAASGAMWQGTAAHFRDRYECHVFSLAGFAGQPALRTGAPYLETMWRELAAYIRAHKLKKPILVGHGLGGMLALGLAAREPELVGKIIAIDSHAYFGTVMDVDTVEKAKPLAEQIRAGISGMSQEEWRQNALGENPWLKKVAADPAKIALAARWSADTDVQTFAQVMYEMMNTDLRNDLRAIKEPVLVFASWIANAPEESRASAERNRRAQFAGLKDWRLRITDTARHFIMFDDEKWMLREMDDFLTERR